MATTVQLMGGVVVAAVCVLTLLINTLVLLLYSKRNRLRIRAHLIPLIHLAVVDWLAVITWSAPSVAIAVADWSPPAEVCQAHAYFGSLWSMIHVYSLALLAVERVIRLVKPSHHVKIFVPKVIAFLLVVLWSLSALLTAVPHFGWLDVALVKPRMQCEVDYDASVSLLDFHLCVSLVLPVLLLVLPCFVLAFLKVRTARRKAKESLTREIVLESGPNTAGRAYAERLAQMQSRFKEVGTSSVKPRMGDKVFTDDGYVTDSDSDVNNVTAKELRTPRKLYSLARREYVLLKTYVIVTCVYVILRLPYAALNLAVNYNPDRSVPDWLETLVTCLSHSPLFVVPLVYLAYNSSFRRCVVKTVCSRRRR